MRSGTRAGLAAFLLSGSTWGANIASLGIGILGVNDEVDQDAGTPWFHAGPASAINDMDSSTRVDTYFGDAPTDQGQGVSFVGIVWPSPRYESIQTLTLDLATFFDEVGLEPMGLVRKPAEL